MMADSRKEEGRLGRSKDRNNKRSPRYANNDDDEDLDDLIPASWSTSSLTSTVTPASSSSLHVPRPTYSATPSPSIKEQPRIENMRSPSPGQKKAFEMQTGTPGTKLAQEIHDEFLVCKICLEVYTNPKCLACLHTFCEACIENHVASESTYKKYSDYREFTCPLCRKRTQLPIGGVKKLPDNFLVSSLAETIGRQRPSKFPFCDICKTVNRKHREASSKCLDCAKLLCKSCVELHRETKVTKNHSIFDVEIKKKKVPTATLR